MAYHKLFYIGFLLVAASVTSAAEDVGHKPAAEPASIVILPPKDLKDVAIARRPDRSESAEAIAVNPKDARKLVVGLIGVVSSKDASACAISVSADGGATWSGPRALPKQRTSCDGIDFKYSQDGKRLYAAYGSEWNVLVSTSADNGATWSAPALALAGSREIDSYMGPQLATPLLASGGQWVYLLARRDGNPGSEFVFARSADRGVTWSPAVHLIDNNLRGGPYVLAGPSITGGRSREILVSWGEVGNDGNQRETRLQTRLSDDYGKTFGNPTTVAQGDITAVDVKIDPFGAAHVVYTSQEKARERLLYASSASPPYATWSRPILVDPAEMTVSRSLSLAIMRCGPIAVLNLVWEDTRLSPPSAKSGVGDIFYARKVARQDGAWSKGLRISDASSLSAPAMLPKLSSSGGQLFAIWTDRRDKTDLNDPETDAYGSRISSGITGCANHSSGSR